MQNANLQKIEQKTTSFAQKEKKLSFKNYRKINGRLHKIYSTTKCKQCPKLKKCTSSRVKEITEVVDPYNEKLKDDYFSDYGQKIYKKEHL